MGEMYGEVNEISQEWFDGLASKVMRLAAQETGEERTWVVFDGPVDALWIENMNTVLDDNMTLCLANGQRIKLRSQMKMLFEVQDLAVCTKTSKVVVEIKGNTELEKAMHSLTFTEEGLVSSFVPYGLVRVTSAEC